MYGYTRQTSRWISSWRIVGIVQERAGNQRRQREQVQDIVAVVGREHRILLDHPQHVAERVRTPLQHAHLLDAPDDRGAVIRRDRDVR